jgi:aryl-alcohol dehydrogenase-like predicted oxidoreductase
MQSRKIGNQGLEVPSLGLGCMGMTFAYQKADESQCLATLDRSLELGLNFWDTAQSYGPFTNEILLGKALKGRREKVVLATKFAWKDGIPGKDNLDGSAQNARNTLEGSLQRLGTDYVDLYYLHRTDPKIPIEESVGAMGKLVREGKVRYIGLSEVGPQTLKRAHRTFPLSALQSEYSLWETGIEEKVLPTLRELGIGLIAFSPVGRGFLTGQLKKFEDLPENDMRRNLPRFQPENFNENLKLVEEVRQLAISKGAQASQIALAWLLAQGVDIVPIPGTTHVTHLEENAGSVLLKLNDSDMGRIKDILSRIKIMGSRYPETMMKMVNLE